MIKLPKVLTQAKQKDLKLIRERLMYQQQYKCGICGCDLKKLKPRDVCVDHQHFGEKRIRRVLCRRCNSVEGKLWNSYVRSTKKERRNDDDYVRMLDGLRVYHLWEPTLWVHPKAIPKKRKKKKKKVK